MADVKTRAKELLKQRSVLARCPDAVLDDIVRRGSVVRHVRGETIYGQGSPGDSLIILLSGSLKITNVTADAREVLLGFAKPGALIGEIAVLDGSPRSADVVALEATEAFVIYRRDLMPVLKGNPDATFALVEGLCSMIRTANSRVENQGMQTQARCAACLASLALQHGRDTGGDGVIIDLKITQRDLGNYLGLTRETVSRTLSEFKDSGLVETKGNTIIILDLAGLQEMAETQHEV